jgi:hypothetical protein
MSIRIKEMPLNEDVTLRVSIKDYYIIMDVFMVVQRIVNDKMIETKFRIYEPYDKFNYFIELCKKKGFDVHRN